MKGVGSPPAGGRITGTIRGIGEPLTEAPHDAKRREYELDVLDISRSIAFGWGTTPSVRLNDAVRSSLRSLGVLDSWSDERHPYAPDSTVSILPLFVFFSGKIGTDFPYPSSATRIARFHSVPFVFLKGRARDGMVLEWQKDHLDVKRDYPESMRILVKDMLDKGILSTDVPELGRSMMADLDLSATTMAAAFVDRLDPPKIPERPRRFKATMPLWCGDENKEDG